MNKGDKFSTPASRSFIPSIPSIPRSSAIKRDSLAAELERDPQLSTAKRQQRTQAFASHMAHGKVEGTRTTAVTRKLELESKVKELERTIHTLEDDRIWLAEREKEEREEKEREREEHLKEKRKADDELRSLRSQLLALREQLADLEDEHTNLNRSTSQTISSQNSQLSTLTRQVAFLESQLEQSQRLADDRARALDELQAQFDDLSLTQNSVTLNQGRGEDLAVVRNELHRQHKYMRELERDKTTMSAQIKTLSNKQESVEVLKEQKRELERKLRGAEELRERVVKLEAELDAARRERQEWASSSAQATAPSKTPVSVTQSLSNLRLTHAQLMEEHGSNVALLQRREQELSELQTREAQTQETVQKLRDDVHDLKKKAIRSQHKTDLVEREVGFLRAMLASFRAEEAANGVVKPEGDTLQPIQELEALVKKQKAIISAREAELEDTRANPITVEDVQAKQQLVTQLQEARATKEQAEEALKEAQSESEKQLERIEELEQELFDLGGEIGGGRHLPPGVRVLSLVGNPAQQWEDLSKAAMDRLRGENEALMRRVKDLEDDGVPSSGHDENASHFVLRESYEVLLSEKLQAEEDERFATKRYVRLKQMYGKKSEEFRQTTAALLGVKLNFTAEGGVHVRSQFDLNTVVTFKPTDTPGIMSLDVGRSENLLQMKRYWVDERGSIPCFLASITLESFDKYKEAQAQQQ